MSVNQGIVKIIEVEDGVSFSIFGFVKGADETGFICGVVDLEEVGFVKDGAGDDEEYEAENEADEAAEDIGFLPFLVYG